MELFNQTIQQSAERAKGRSILALFDQINRADDFSVEAAGLYLDYSKKIFLNLN